MKTHTKFLVSTSLLTAGALVASPAFAAGTAAGTTIQNEVTVSYNVGTVAQTDIEATDEIIVDRKIDLVVQELGSNTTTVNPNETQVVTTFTVTNLSNATLDFLLSATDGSGDDFDISGGYTFYVDNESAGVSGSLDAADGAPVTNLDDIVADDIVTVFVVGASVPGTVVNAEEADVILTAAARETTGGALTGVLTSGDANTAAMDTVLADAAGETDALRDGAHSALDTYVVSAAGLTVTKSSRVIDDPVNGTTNPKMIPGATVEYCIAVVNASGSATASGINISDTLPSGLVFVPGSIVINGSLAGAGSDPTDCDTGTGSAGGSFSGNTVSGGLSDIAGGSNGTLVFQATIDPS
ncbi:DUF11 domain-containing protein [Alteraurantiacibacter aquimixticola]|uniref:DUF11 domain-containing protein n=1 Tax=Alteraurantiacibacter aquimixticola TaxID=2489173 RepID=A0A4T3F1Z9_9SPHN|nr:DUF11 domain-containing protein [Alteraurantiacibacter aquimixticola]TIX51255.1 DUF11 domain-containing protein [Alteraurantiacibacter aquimixticola]